MASYKRTSLERVRVLEAGAEGAAGVGAGGEGLLWMRCLYYPIQTGVSNNFHYCQKTKAGAGTGGGQKPNTFSLSQCNSTMVYTLTRKKQKYLVFRN